MANDPLEESSQHHAAPRRGYGPVLSSETVAIALFGSNPRVGSAVVQSDIDSDQLKNRDQSVCRMCWTTARIFFRRVVTTRRGEERKVAGIASVKVEKLRKLQFVTGALNQQIRGPAVCVIDKVETDDYDGHAAIGFTQELENLTNNQKMKTKPRVRLDVAKEFGNIHDPKMFKWEPPLSFYFKAALKWWARFLAGLRA